MRSKSIFELQLSSDELLLILGYLNIHQIPSFISLTNASDIDIKHAKKSLTNKNFIRQAPNQNIVVDTSVVTLITSLIQARHGIEVIKIAKNGHSNIHQTYLYANHLILEYEGAKNDNKHILRAIRNRQTLVERLKQILAISTTVTESSSLVFQIDLESCFHAPDVFASNGKSDGVTYLRNKGLSSNLIELLTRLFHAPGSQYRLQLVSWVENQIQVLKWLIVVEDIFGAWLFQEDSKNKNLVTITSLDKLSAEKKVGQFFDQLVMLEEPSINL